MNNGSTRQNRVATTKGLANRHSTRTGGLASVIIAYKPLNAFEFSPLKEARAFPLE
jgi:hypothetical protein